MTLVLGSLGLCSASCWIRDLSDAEFMTSPGMKIALKVPLPGKLGVMEPNNPSTAFGHDPGENDQHVFVAGKSVPDDTTPCSRTDESTGRIEGLGSSVTFVPMVMTPRSSGLVDTPMPSFSENPMTSCGRGEDPMLLAQTEDPTLLVHTEDPRTLVGDGPRSSLRSTEDPDDPRAEGRLFVDSLFVDDESPNLPPGNVYASSSSWSSDSRVSSDEDPLDEVQQTKKARKKAKVKVCLNLPGSSLSDEKSLQHLRRKCGISKEIVLVASSLADRDKIKKDCDDKLTKLKSRCTKAEGEIVQLRGELSSASDLPRTRIEIGGKVQNDMLNLAEIDANLEFIGLLQGSEPLDLPTEVKALHDRRHPIYDARDVFADLLASIRRVLEIHVVSAGAVEASVAVDDDVEVTDKDNVEVTDDDEDAED
ncbi:hypothetical protein AALP_AA6G195400 [Arabis alpina]|uniref:Uncharacterized protein n=1 Tax=Arabis alpina TaxID=50452 RepID=A0A087GQB6_ARAAL|nr:hypothetical protein AALP_AA6G195400 [Arabis alpina]